MIKSIITALLVIGLSACATTPLKQSYQLGEANFKAQNYQLAFKQLQPAAAHGSAEAQYALGYMYYYGLGTPKNINLARMWIDKSAAQGLAKAQKAMALIDAPVWGE
ncbi:MAG: SEL1-like repeat protein [Legionellales bacterium]|nr:SEL1-like repeat protein [Legionellales bacterium]